MNPQPVPRPEWPPVDFSAPEHAGSVYERRLSFEYELSQRFTQPQPPRPTLTRGT